jgi:hypothetical protein
MVQLTGVRGSVTPDLTRAVALNEAHGCHAFI